jgi:hypothetical protein
MPTKISKEEHEVIIEILKKTKAKIGHEAIRELYNMDSQLKKIGMARQPLTLLHRLSMLWIAFKF